MWSASIFHGQVQCTICPCEILGKPPQGQLHSCGIFIKDTQTPHRHQPHPAESSEAGPGCSALGSPAHLFWSTALGCSRGDHGLHRTSECLHPGWLWPPGGRRRPREPFTGTFCMQSLHSTTESGPRSPSFRALTLHSLYNQPP